MTNEKQIVIDEIDRKTSLIIETANRIWEYAELSLQEFKSAAY